MAARRSGTLRARQHIRYRRSDDWNWLGLHRCQFADRRCLGSCDVALHSVVIGGIRGHCEKTRMGPTPAIAHSLWHLPLFVRHRFARWSHLLVDVRSESATGCPIRKYHQMRPGAVAIAAVSRLAAIIALPILSPILLLTAAAVVIEDGLPVFFLHTRVGRNGRPFKIVKFRSMRSGQPGRQITAGGDARITRVGRFIRKYKLDELPQIWNLVTGDMSLIGPRPEAPAFVDMKDPKWRTILQATPGVTDLATLIYRNEEEILAGAADPEVMYRKKILPKKLALNEMYLQSRSLWSDAKLIMLTAWYSLRPVNFDPERVKKLICKDAI